MGLPAGRLDRRIALKRVTVARDGHNQPTESWSSLATVWASWRRANTNERLADGQTTAQATDVFEIRWSSAVAALNPKDRIEYQGKLYDIVGVAEIGRRVGLTVTAAVRVD